MLCLCVRMCGLFSCFSSQFFEGTGGGKNEKKVTSDRSHNENSSVGSHATKPCPYFKPLYKERAQKLPAVNIGLVAGGSRFS